MTCWGGTVDHLFDRAHLLSRGELVDRISALNRQIALEQDVLARLDSIQERVNLVNALKVVDVYGPKNMSLS